MWRYGERTATRADHAAEPTHPAPGRSTLVEAIQRRAPPGAPGHAPTVQAAAARGTSGVAEPLPHLARIQALFGRHDISGVRAYVGGHAAEGSAAMGAQAYATGEQIAFRAAPDLHTAAHEAAHVVQQRAGVQLAGGVGQAGDGYEHHADQVADAVVRGESAEALLDRMVGRGASGEGRAPGGGVQRKVVLGGTDIHKSGDAPLEQTAPYNFTRDYTAIVDRAIAALPEDIRPTDGELRGLLPELTHTLQTWADAGTGGALTVLSGQTAHERVYDNDEQLGRALIGTVRASANMRREQALAKEARTSQTIRDGVADCMRCVSRQIDADFASDGQFADHAKRMKLDLGKLRSRYWWWYLGADIFANLQNPAPANLDKNVSILHDLEDYFRYGNKWKREAYGDFRDRKGTVGERPDDAMSATHDQDLGDYRTNWTSVKETNPWIQTARAHATPVWAGPSVTTGRMLTFAQACGAGGAQLGALAWGIWAFWNTSYYSGMSGIHTFHEVMDIARGFGVAYTPFQYPAHALGVST
jgi:hypothetical protein